jgi:hypothetical protein
MGELDLFNQDNVYLFVLMRTCSGKYEVGALEPGLNTKWQIVLGGNPQDIFFVNCVKCLIWNWSFYKPVLCFPFCLLAEWETVVSVWIVWWLSKFVFHIYLRLRKAVGQNVGKSTNFAIKVFDRVIDIACIKQVIGMVWKRNFEYDK